MVDSFLTRVMRRQCSFFNGLCYMILRILRYGRSIFTHLANSYANFTGMKESFYWFTCTAAVLAHQFGRRDVI